MYQVLYIPNDGSVIQLFSLGVFDSEQEAMDAIRNAVATNEFSWIDTKVYLMYPNRLIDEIDEI